MQRVTRDEAIPIEEKPAQSSNLLSFTYSASNNNQLPDSTSSIDYRHHQMNTATWLGI
jgi:hypothetical protein